MAESTASAAISASSNESLSYQQIAEAAYLRYLGRGCEDGQDFEDWIEAERRLRAGR